MHALLLLVPSLIGSWPATDTPTFDPYAYQPGVSTLLATAPAPVPQDDNGWDFSYTYLEVGATRFDVEDIDDEADIFYGEAALDIFNIVYLLIGYENAEIDFGNTDQDLFRLGAGAHFSLGNRLDIMGDIAWMYSDLSSDVFDETSNGSQIRIGARWMPWRFTSGGLELQGRGLWVNLPDSYFSESTQVGFDVGARLHLLKLFSIGATYTLLEEDDSASINARVSF